MDGEGCNTSFAIPFVINQTLCASGAKSRLFQCSNCKKGYSSKGALARHLKFECQQEPIFQCPLCPKKCARKYNLLRHVAVVHNTALI